GITTRKRQQVCAHLHRFSVCRFRAMTDRIYGKAAVPSSENCHFSIAFLPSQFPDLCGAYRYCYIVCKNGRNVTR
ncbi:MAG: hypothetical protein ACLSTI_04925, partial [Ruminococcus sp.]